MKSNVPLIYIYILRLFRHKKKLTGYECACVTFSVAHALLKHEQTYLLSIAKKYIYQIR